MPSRRRTERDSHLRSWLKGISWRVVATSTTAVVAWLWTHSWRSALSIGSAELIAKIVLYYLHERAWQHVAWGSAPEPLALSAEPYYMPRASSPRDSETHLRSVVKGISWRMLATAATVTIALAVLGDRGVALGIGSVEFLAKVFLYYVHERAWEIKA